MSDSQNMHLPWEVVEYPAELNAAYPEEMRDERFQIVDAEGFVVTALALEDGKEMLQFIVRACNAFPKMLHALAMIRDADNDAKADGPPHIPRTARFVIDDALADAELVAQDAEASRAQRTTDK